MGNLKTNGTDLSIIILRDRMDDMFVLLSSFDERLHKLVRQEMVQNNFSHKYILLIDADNEITHTINDIASHENYDLTIVSNLEEALYVMNSINHDIIIVNNSMSKYDEMQICQEIRNDTKRKNIPILFIIKNRDQLLKCDHYKLVDSIVVPTNTIEILCKIKIYLSLKSAHDDRNKLLLTFHEAITQIHEVMNVIPICSHCKRIRDENGYWYQANIDYDEYQNLQYSHTICPECLHKYYPEIASEIFI